MMRQRHNNPFVLVAFVIVACRAAPERVDASITPDTSATTATPKRVGICEPTVACGVWSPCSWIDVDHVDPSGVTVYRISGSDAGARFTRVRSCFPADAGYRSCSVYCTPTGTGCNDALTSDAPCTGSAAPRMSPFQCDVHGSSCDTRP